MNVSNAKGTEMVREETTRVCTTKMVCLCRGGPTVRSHKRRAFASISNSRLFVEANT